MPLDRNIKKVLVLVLAPSSSARLRSLTTPVPRPAAP